MIVWVRMSDHFWHQLIHVVLEMAVKWLCAFTSLYTCLCVPQVKPGPKGNL